MGIDYGEARIGVALSDPEGKIAFPRETVENRGNPGVFAYLKALAKKEKVGEIIVGLPLGMRRQDTEESRRVRTFARRLHTATGLAVEFENEMFTTRMAEEAGGRRELRDASAAAIILQSYLDKVNQESGSQERCHPFVTPDP